MAINPKQLGEALFKISEGERKLKIGTDGRQVHLDRLADLVKEAQKNRTSVDPQKAKDALASIEANRKFAVDGASLVEEGLTELAALSPKNE